jgi:hypothetical protein
VNVFSHRRIIVRDGLIDVPTLSAQQSTLIVQAWMPASISLLSVEYFKSLKQFDSISFEGDSRLTRIESFAFSSSSLRSIVILCSTEILGPSCFRECRSLSSISFESPPETRIVCQLEWERLTRPAFICILCQETRRWPTWENETDPMRPQGSKTVNSRSLASRSVSTSRAALCARVKPIGTSQNADCASGLCQIPAV